MQSQMYPVPPPGASAMDTRGEQKRVHMGPGGTDYAEEHKDEHKKKSVVEKVKQKAKKLTSKIRHPKGHGHGGEHAQEEHGHEDDTGSEDETEETVSPATHSDKEVHGGDQYMKTVSGLETFGTKNIFDKAPLETDPNVRYGTQEQPKGVPADHRAAADRPVTGEEALKRKTEIPSSIVEQHPGITSESAGVSSLLASRGSGGDQTTQIGSKAAGSDQTSGIGSKTGTKSYEDAVSDRRFRDEGVGKVKDPIIPITGVVPEEQRKVDSYRDEERPKAYDDYVSDRRYRDEAAGKPEAPIIPLTGFSPEFEDRTDKQRSTDRSYDRNLDVSSTQEAGPGLRPVSGGQDKEGRDLVGFFGGQDKEGRDLNVVRKIGDEGVSDAQLPEEERPVSHVNLDTDKNNVQRAFDSDPSGFKLHPTSTAQAELQPQGSEETNPFMTKIEAEPETEAGYGSQTGAAESKPITQRAYDTIVGGSLAVAGMGGSLLGFNKQSVGEEHNREGQHQPLNEGKDKTYPDQYEPLQEEGKDRPYPADEHQGHDQHEGTQGKPYTQRVTETVASLKNILVSKLGTGQAAESHEGTPREYPQEGTAEEYRPSEEVELSKAPHTPEQHEEDRASSGSYIGSLTEKAKGTVFGLKDNVTLSWGMDKVVLLRKMKGKLQH